MQEGKTAICRDNGHKFQQKKSFFRKNGRLYTNKPNKQKHGFGLKSIRKIVNSYHGDLQMYYHPDTRTFHTVITLKQS